MNDHHNLGANAPEVCAIENLFSVAPKEKMQVWLFPNVEQVERENNFGALSMATTTQNKKAVNFVNCSINSSVKVDNTLGIATIALSTPKNKRATPIRSE